MCPLKFERVAWIGDIRETINGSCTDFHLLN
jgi:hypothetical protein